MKKASHFPIVTQVMEGEGRMAAGPGHEWIGNGISLRLTDTGSNRELIFGLKRFNRSIL